MLRQAQVRDFYKYGGTIVFPVATWEFSSFPIIFSILAALVSPVADNLFIAPGVVSKPLASNTSGMP